MSVARYPSAQELLDQAVAGSGLSEFGPGDFREGLRVLLESLECDGDLQPDAGAAVLGDFGRRLVNRLEVEAWYEAHPEVEDVAIRGPVDINGLPRTGTTALADMLSLDPQFRCLRGWEQTKPVPPPIRADEADDPRRRSFEESHGSRSEEQRAMHIFEVDAAMEDTEVLGMAFHGQQMMLPVPSYRRWWRAADLTQTYAYHRRVVKLLGSRRHPDLWLFKAPHHKFHLEALASAYPDVRFIMTHRDPGKVVPSYASLVLSDHTTGRGRTRPGDIRPGGVRPPAHRDGTSDGAARAPRRGPFPRRAPPGTGRRPEGLHPADLHVAGPGALSRPGANDHRMAGGKPYGREWDPPLHDQSSSDSPRSRSVPITTSTSNASKSPWKETRHDRIPHMERPAPSSDGCRGRIARHLATRRPHRRRGAGHDEARALHPRLRLFVPRVYGRPSAGVHAPVELRLQPGRPEPRLRLSQRPGRCRTACTSSPGSVAPLASSRSRSRSTR